MHIQIKRGEIWLVNLMPIVGHEQDKMRPCVVISNDQVNTGLWQKSSYADVMMAFS